MRSELRVVNWIVESRRFGGLGIGNEFGEGNGAGGEGDLIEKGAA